MATHHKMGGVLHFLLALAAIAVLTELALRWRDQRTAVPAIARAERRPDLPKAA